MLYLAPPSTPPVREAMHAGLLGCITTPNQGNAIPDAVVYGADNSRYGTRRPELARWRQWLTGTVQRYGRDRCLFATVPDEPFDHDETLRLWRTWRHCVATLEVPAAFVAQEGSERPGAIPWDEVDVLFIGGADAWKDGAGGRAVADAAHERGLTVHLGRVNGWTRYQYGAQVLRAETCDGTTIARGPDENLPRVLGWVRRLAAEPWLFDPFTLARGTGA